MSSALQYHKPKGPQQLLCNICLIKIIIKNKNKSLYLSVNVFSTEHSNWNLEVLVFEEGGKLEYPEKNLSEQG